MPLTLEEIRGFLPSLSGGAYLNTGYCGPLPVSAAQAMSDQHDADLNYPRGRPDAFDEELRLALEAKQAFASLLEGVSVRELALTDSTSQGLGIFLAGLGLTPGDEIVTTDEEHSGLGAVLAAATTWGCELVVVPFSPTADLPDAIARAVTDRTRAVAISHISYVSGSAAPVREIADVLPEGVPLLLDAAHTVGAVAFDPGRTGAAAVAFPGQKWCLGPEGIGGLWVSPNWIDRIRPTTVSFRAMAKWESPLEWDFESGSAKLDQGTVNKPVLAGLIESVRWMRDDVGLERVFEMTRTGARYARDSLAHLDAVLLLTEPDSLGGLAGFRIRGLRSADEYEAAAEYLWGEGVRIRHIENPPALRASVGFFNTESEVDLLCAKVESLSPT